MTQVTLGGDRLGSGKKQKISMRNFERSTHNLGYLWKSTIAPGVLTPFYNDLMLPGDTFDIDLDLDIKTLPTKGPLFGSFKVQLDLFAIPVRLYNAKLHMNALNIGMAMNEVLLPQLTLQGRPLTGNIDHGNAHTHPSSLLANLGIRGCGGNRIGDMQREFNAVSYLGYWDTVKQYYANKQEKLAWYIHTPITTGVTMSGMYFYSKYGDTPLSISSDDITKRDCFFTNESNVRVDLSNAGGDPVEISKIYWTMQLKGGTQVLYIRLDQVFQSFQNIGGSVYFNYPKPQYIGYTYEVWGREYRDSVIPEGDNTPVLKSFDLTNIDQMREDILKHFSTVPFKIDANSIEPYGAPLEYNTGVSPTMFAMEGLAVKTYQSDMLNNWIQTEWIDGENGISAITAVDTSQGFFTIDELNLSKKVYDMLNRIALSGGTYDDWLDVVYTEERRKAPENPMYLGGLSDRLEFQQVVSNSDTYQANESGSTGEKLGALAGRGTLGGNRKGGKVIVRADEPQMILGLVSLTPIISYSNGNAWHTNLKTVDDFHKPSLDQIGFQDLITDKMHFADTIINAGTPTFMSAGKQPAWIDYMSAVNIDRGNFAIESDQMFMTLNRRYEIEPADTNQMAIADLTTYIDPAKYNYIFADARLDSQNFWCQIALNITGRRKMSAKVIPNL